jgi:hypothetical protein
MINPILIYIDNLEMAVGVVGIILAIVIAVTLIVALVVWYICKRRKK